MLGARAKVGNCTMLDMKRALGDCLPYSSGPQWNSNHTTNIPCHLHDVNPHNLESFLHELTHAVSLPCWNDEVIGLLLLQHEPHGLPYKQNAKQMLHKLTTKCRTRSQTKACYVSSFKIVYSIPSDRTHEVASLHIPFNNIREIKGTDLHTLKDIK